MTLAETTNRSTKRARPGRPAARFPGNVRVARCARSTHGASDRSSAARGRRTTEGGRSALVDALTGLYAYSYEADASAVRLAAELRAEAMEVSDRWVDAGCDPADPRLAQERSLLIRSFAALPAAVHRP